VKLCALFEQVHREIALGHVLDLGEELIGQD